jgi:hypothetical protein
METVNTPVKKKRSYWIWMILVLLIAFYFIFGFITIQPIGVIPDGLTLLVIRAGTQLKFFDSPDAICQRTMDGVSLLCRGMVMSSIAENVTIVLRLPFFESFYLASTGGYTYGR